MTTEIVKHGWVQMTNPAKEDGAGLMAIEAWGIQTGMWVSPTITSTDGMMRTVCWPTGMERWLDTPDGMMPRAQTLGINLASFVKGNPVTSRGASAAYSKTNEISHSLILLKTFFYFANKRKQVVIFSSSAKNQTQILSTSYRHAYVRPIVNWYKCDKLSTNIKSWEELIHDDDLSWKTVPSSASRRCRMVRVCAVGPLAGGLHPHQ